MKLRLMFMCMVLAVVAGCQEGQMSMRAQLPPTLPGWEARFGDSDQSNLYSNIYVLMAKAQEQRRINAAITRKLELLEAVDPNHYDLEARVDRLAESLIENAKAHYEFRENMVVALESIATDVNGFGIALGIQRAPDIVFDASSWMDPNATIVCDTNNSILWELPPTHCYTFDVNTDPMVMGKMFHRWMQANPEGWSQFCLCVPVEDKAEYDVIIAGKGKN